MDGRFGEGIQVPEKQHQQRGVTNPYFDTTSPDKNFIIDSKNQQNIKEEHVRSLSVFSSMTSEGETQIDIHGYTY